MRPASAPGAAWLSAPALSGVLLFLSFPPFALGLPPFVALVPVLVLLATTPPDTAGRWRAAGSGYLLGLVFFGLLLHWMALSLVHFSLLAIPAYLLTVMILAGFTAAFAVLLHLLHARRAPHLAIAAALAWTGMEWAQGRLHDLSFPWLGLGTALAPFPRLAGAADLVGARGLSFWLVLVNGWVALAVLAARAGQPARTALRHLAMAGAVAALPIGYGFWRAATLELRPVATVAVVQPNIPEELGLDRAQAADTALASLERLTRRIPPGSVDLVVWPEVAVPVLLDQPREQAVRLRIQRLSADVGAPILTGAWGSALTRQRALFYNAAFMAGAEGLIGEPYYKRQLVPFVERVPFVEPARFRRIFGENPYFGGLAAGSAAHLFEVGEVRFGVLICYESIFWRLAREYRRDGADLLINITNDAWFGRESARPARTGGLWQHPAHAVMRAIETRTAVARAANTGVSMFVDPIGRVHEATPLFTPDIRVATIRAVAAAPPFVRWGDVVGTGAAILVAALVAGLHASRTCQGLAARLGFKGFGANTAGGER